MTHRDEIQRFSFGERFIHWGVALSFVYLLLTGLALFTPGLYWLGVVFGGGTTIRRWHPIIGVVFGFFLVVMYFKWRRDMKIDATDRAWLAQIRRYIRGEEDLPEADRFNAGQKLLFKYMVFFGLCLLLSGIPLWFPLSFSVQLRTIAILVHEISAIAVFAGIIAHVYMATAVVRGSLHGMLTGYVSRAWARVHHPRWYRQISGAE